MGILLKYRFKEAGDASHLSIFDETGMYHPVRNTSGWEGPNNDISEVTASNALITLPDGTTLLPVGTPKIISVFPTLPNVSGAEMEITAPSLGYTSGKLPDGLYDITIKHTLSSGSFLSFRKKEVLWTRVDCCIESLGAEITLESCNQNTQKYRDWKEATFNLDIMKRAILCGNINRSLEWLKKLQAICARNPCKTC